MTDTCQKLNCNRTGELRILYTSEYTPDQHVGAYACKKHKGELWREFEDHDHYYPIETEEV